MNLRFLLSLGQSIRDCKRRVWICSCSPYWDALQCHLLLVSMLQLSHGTQLQRGYCHTGWQVEVKKAVNKPERMSEETVQGLEKRSQCPPGCCAQSSPGRAPAGGHQLLPWGWTEVQPGCVDLYFMLHGGVQLVTLYFFAKSFLLTLLLAWNNCFIYQSASGMLNPHPYWDITSKPIYNRVSPELFSFTKKRSQLSLVWRIPIPHLPWQVSFFLSWDDVKASQGQEEAPDTP